MKALLLVSVLVGAVACGGSAPPAAAPSIRAADRSHSEGAAERQASENANRALTADECTELGEYIAGVCHDTNSRQARIEGWCGDMVARTTSGTWAADCQKSLKYMDSVCYRSTDNAPSMMACDRNAGL
jgi:hypothetical protein